MRQFRLVPVWGLILAIPLFFTACGGSNSSTGTANPTATKSGTSATATTGTSSDNVALCALLPQADILRILNVQLVPTIPPALNDSPGFGSIKSHSDCTYFFSAEELNTLDYQIFHYTNTDIAKATYSIFPADPTCKLVSGLGDEACQTGVDGDQNVRINLRKGTYTVSINRGGSASATSELTQLLQVLLPNLT